MIRAKIRRVPNQFEVLVVVLVIGLSTFQTCLAEEHHDSEAHGHEHSFHKNVIAGFVGFTGEDDRMGSGRERALTLGLEYERRFSESFGVLVAAERAFGDLDFTVITVPLVYHRNRWAFTIGPGIEIPDDDHDNEFVFRTAATYGWILRDNRELSPKIGLDFVNGEVVFFAGMIVGFGF